MMDISFSNELCYMSASSSSQEMLFYSVPTSPRFKSREQHHGSQTSPTTPSSYEDANSNLDGFEFETSRRFNHSELNQKDVKLADHQKEQKQQRLCGEAPLPTMAFADELFCDGKVIPLIIPPLKLPPRLAQNGDGNIMSTQSSTVTSPRSPGSVLRFPFSRFWNDDFDPFMVALEKVREEKRVKPKGDDRHSLRRSRSHSPFRGSNKFEKHVGLSELHQHESHWYETAQLLCELQEEALKKASGRKHILSEAKVANEKNFEPKRTLDSKVAKETKKDESQRGGFWRRNKMKENIKKFLFGSKTSTEHKVEDKKEAPGKPTLLKKLDMKTESTIWNKDETTGELNKMRLACYRPLPKLSLCLGYERWKGK